MRLFGKDCEEELAERLRNGESKAMQDFYSLYAGGLAAVCSRYVGNDADRDDVFQECMINIMSNIGKFNYRGKGSLKAWVTRIAVNESIDFLKEKRRYEPATTDFDVPDVVEEPDPEIENIPPEVIQDMIRQLPTGYRTVFNLYVLEGKSHKEIAEMLGIKKMSSASQLHRAKNILAREINKYMANKERQR